MTPNNRWRSFMTAGVIALWALGFTGTTIYADDGRSDGARPSSEVPVCPGTRRAVLLSGGGIRGAYQLGALWYLVNVARCDFHYFAGTSTGAITAAVLSQASDFEELQGYLEKLISHYLDLREQSDVASERPFGRLRLMLPKWLGGVDGVATLEPLEKKLWSLLNFGKVDHSKLDIMVFSLQTGAMPRGLAMDTLDAVVGSASIPLLVSPRRARVQTFGVLRRLENDVLTVVLPGIAPGAPDPQCSILINRQTVARCEAIGLVSSNDYTQVYKLRVLDLTSELRTLLEAHIVTDKTQAEGEMDARTTRSEESASNHELLTFFRDQTRFGFTSIHQLIDGGTTAFAPVDYASGGRQEVDTVFLLLTGGNRRQTHYDRMLRDGVAIAEKAFEALWSDYQERTMDLLERDLRLWAHLCRTKKLLFPLTGMPRDRIREFLGSSKVAREERRLGVPFAEWPNDEARRILDDATRRIMRGRDCDETEKRRVLILRPGDTRFDHTFDVSPSAIRHALHHGCLIAAQVFGGIVRWYYDPRGRPNPHALWAEWAAEGLEQALEDERIVEHVERIWLGAPFKEGPIDSAACAPMAR